MKTHWTWDEWQKSRAQRRAASDQISAKPCRRRESSADQRLHAAFGGARGPAFPPSTAERPLLNDQP